VTEKEMERAIGVLPQASQYAVQLREGDDWVNPFEPVGGRLYALETLEDGRCMYSYRGPRGETWCAIHSAALDLGLDPWTTKPKSCLLWPLALSTGRPPVLSIQDDARRFPCNTRNRHDARAIDPGIGDLLARAFGDEFRRQVEAAAERMHDTPPE